MSYFVLVAFANEADHKQHLQQFFSRLTQFYGLKLNPIKCFLKNTSVALIGCLVTLTDVKHFLRKLQAIT